MRGVYYNEHDPFAAAWLRELIADGLIAPGEVDERSIAEVSPDDVRGFAQAHFFAGIGGWSYALRLAGWDDTRPVWTGSPPCQPFSAAGKGLARDDERHLAPVWLRLVAECRPAVIFGEQVASKPVLGPAKPARRLLGAEPEWAWFDDLCARLEGARYAVGAADIPAAGVGAPHIRQRLFFGAVRAEDADGQRCDGLGLHLRGRGSLEGVPETAGGSGAGRVEHAAGVGQRSDEAGRGGGVGEPLEGPRARRDDEFGRATGGLADTERDGAGAGAGASAARQDAGRAGGGLCAEPCDDGADGRVADADLGVQGRGRVFGPGEGLGSGAGAERERSAGLCGAGGVDDSASARHVGPIEEPEGDPRDEARLRVPDKGRGVGRVADADGGLATDGDAQRGGQHGREPQDGGAGGGAGGRAWADAARDAARPCAPHGGWAAADWLLCRDGKWRPAEPSIFPLADGVPNRVGLLRGAGNAIVPQAAAAFIAAFREALA